MSGILFVLVLLAGVAAALWGWDRYSRFADSALMGAQEAASVVVERGDSFDRILSRLRQVGVTGGHDLEWKLLARQLDAGSRVHVGEYAIGPQTTPRSLLQDMRNGRTIVYRFTIVEGWNIRELRAALARATPLEQRIGGLDNAALMAELGKPEVHPEGRFLPETYVYTRGDSDLDILRRASVALDKALEEVWAARSERTPVETPEQALILASIIEKETGIAEERPQIAGVFARRLKLGMRLQTDPTVIYGVGDAYAGVILRSHLETDTPYNTYTRAGLPPTPIAMVGVDALRSATHPAEGDSLFFVAVGDGSGRHVFTRDYADHRSAVAEYRQRLLERKGPQ